MNDTQNACRQIENQCERIKSAAARVYPADADSDLDFPLKLRILETEVAILTCALDRIKATAGKAV